MVARRPVAVRVETVFTVCNADGRFRRAPLVCYSTVPESRTIDARRWYTLAPRAIGMTTWHSRSGAAVPARGLRNYRITHLVRPRTSASASNLESSLFARPVTTIAGGDEHAVKEAPGSAQSGLVVLLRGIMMLLVIFLENHCNRVAAQ